MRLRSSLKTGLTYPNELAKGRTQEGGWRDYLLHKTLRNVISIIRFFRVKGALSILLCHKQAVNRLYLPPSKMIGSFSWLRRELFLPRERLSSSRKFSVRSSISWLACFKARCASRRMGSLSSLGAAGFLWGSSRERGGETEREIGRAHV